jgi:hypothetical protein
LKSLGTSLPVGTFMNAMSNSALRKKVRNYKGFKL